MSNWKYFFSILGLCALLISVFNWEWYYQNLGVGTSVRMIGRTGTRIAYAVVGLVLLGAAVGGFMGLIR